MSTLGTPGDLSKNQEECEMWMSLHVLQKNHKINDNFPSTTYDNLTKHVTIKKWDVKEPHPSGNNPRVPKSILQQAKYHIWIICTNLHRHQ